MNAPSLLALARRIPVAPSLRRYPINSGSLLGLMGLARRRTRRPSSSIVLVATSLLVGAAAALLFSPSSGRDLRQRMGKRLGSGTGGFLGKVVGAQVGAHPVGTAKVAKTARDLLGAKD